MEVTQHVNETTVRCIMLSASEGLGKGMPVEATGHGLTAPVGEGTPVSYTHLFRAVREGFFTKGEKVPARYYAPVLFVLK